VSSSFIVTRTFSELSQNREVKRIWRGLKPSAKKGLQVVLMQIADFTIAKRIAEKLLPPDNS